MNFKLMKPAVFLNKEKARAITEAELNNEDLDSLILFTERNSKNTIKLITASDFKNQYPDLF